jgi:hypothetical protein
MFDYKICPINGLQCGRSCAWNLKNMCTLTDMAISLKRLNANLKQKDLLDRLVKFKSEESK